MRNKRTIIVCLLGLGFLQNCTCNKEGSSSQVQTSPGPSKQNDSLAFGDKSWIGNGLEGRIYYLQEGTTQLPKSFDTMKVQGTIYTKTIDVPNRSWSTGFPGVSNRFEWFAIVYSGSFKAKKPGHYTFRLSSDDGSKLFIDDSLIVNNDGAHAVSSATGQFDLDNSTHNITVQYFQGPRFYVALQLFARLDKEQEQIFPGNYFTLSTPGSHQYMTWIIVGVLMVIILLLVLFLRSRRKEKQPGS